MSQRRSRSANIVKAIASFERTLVSGDSPLDRYLYRDDKSGMSAAALRGMTAFFSKRLRCGECHGSFNLSGPVDFDGATKAGELVFHNTGLYDVDGHGAYPSIDRGLFDITARKSDMGRFRAPTLRNVAVTAPYMHDGSVATLEERRHSLRDRRKAEPVPQRSGPGVPGVGRREGRPDRIPRKPDGSAVSIESCVFGARRVPKPQAKSANERPNQHGGSGTSQ